jgi:nicotinate-nucleotide adenylyltransferase
MSRRIGILGGTFDPVHIGHLILASCARDQLRTDEFILIPNSRSPLKSSEPVAPFADRFEMLSLALVESGQFSASDIEGQRGEISYMVDTLGAVRDSRPGAELHLVLGSDSVRDLPRWRDAGTILRLARLAVVARDGCVPDELPEGATVIQMPRIDISASLIRQNVAAGLSIDFLTPASVVSHIRRIGLYRSS